MSIDQKTIDRMLGDARALDCMGKSSLSQPQIALECTSHIRALLEEVIRLQRYERATCTADRVEKLRHHIEGNIKLLASVAGINVRPILHDVQLLACLALDAGESCTATTYDG